MPWQAAPSLIIIFGAFNVAAGLIWTVDRAYYGKVCVFFMYCNLMEILGFVGIGVDLC